MKGKINFIQYWNTLYMGRYRHRIPGVIKYNDINDKM